MARAGLVISHLFRRPTAGLRRLAGSAAAWSLRRLPEEPWLAGTPRRRVFHWGLGPVEADFPKRFVAEGLDRYLAERDVALFSFDLGPAASRHLYSLPLARPLGREAILRRMGKMVALLRRHYQGPLAAENYNFYPSGLYDHVTEPGFVGRCLGELGLGLCLDLAHAAVTAHNLGLGLGDYLAALPLEKTVEVHLSRPYLPGGRLLAADTHDAPREREWGWLELALGDPRLPRDATVFVEYYQCAGHLPRLQKRLEETLRRY